METLLQACSCLLAVLLSTEVQLAGAERQELSFRGERSAAAQSESWAAFARLGWRCDARDFGGLSLNSLLRWMRI